MTYDIRLVHTTDTTFSISCDLVAVRMCNARNNSGWNLHQSQGPQARQGAADEEEGVESAPSCFDGMARWL
jgi:hypothetical protein